MAKSSMKNALSAALDAESAAFKTRLARADAALGAAPVSDLDDAAPATKTGERVVREAFTLPETEHAQIARLRGQLLGTGVHVTKSEVMRAGLLLLGEMDAKALQEVFGRVEKIKTGRPKTI